MPYDPEHHHRRSIRARAYDYAQPGSYFVTICAWQRAAEPGEVVDGVMVPNGVGALVRNRWQELPGQFPGIVLDSFVITPNHVHGIKKLGASP